eukprot:scaffold1356_cov123-Cylindrotheca_fusiformis.AAC.54
MGTLLHVAHKKKKKKITGSTAQTLHYLPIKQYTMTWNQFVQSIRGGATQLVRGGGGATAGGTKRVGQQTASTTTTTTNATRQVSTQKQVPKETAANLQENQNKPTFDTWDFMVLDVRFLLVE